MKDVLIALVDDNADVRRTLSLLLEGQARFVEAADGLEGSRLINELKPVVAIVDLSMPLAGGLELLRLTTGRRGGTKILMLTSQDDVEAARAALEAGADAYVTKPCDADRLREDVRRLIGAPPPPDARPWRVEVPS